ncbi:hypothetical protein CF336_g8197 [Tilletia laevis]|uniref:Uncharacterized protein n=1 Tax=Tilletia caries TaxID=13290 RepID=A0A177U7P2_9BASI|nr:hypothetical protein CF336_g8197 [Tilletia laevis]KAE8185212.1 hypothetical protein CF335_g7786 [Tilletia laevis]KAE8243180.1 hypothetical protein A4X03_0g7846 [Tilletia caries]
MFAPRLILLVLFLLLATLANSAPLPDGQAPYCLNQSPPSTPPEARPALPLRPDIDLWMEAHQELTGDYNRLWRQAEQAGLRNLMNLPNDQFEHVNEIMAEAGRVQEQLQEVVRQIQLLRGVARP